MSTRQLGIYITQLSLWDQMISVFTNVLYSSSQILSTKSLTKVIARSALPITSAIYVLALPVGLQKDIFVSIQEDFVIQLNEASPSMSALNDVHIAEQSEETKSFEITENLGTSSKAWNPAQLNERANLIKPELKVAVLEPEAVQVDMTVSELSEVVLQGSPVLHDDSGNLLSLERRKKNLFDYYSQRSDLYAAATVNDRAQQLVKRALIEQPLKGDRGHLTSKTSKFRKSSQNIAQTDRRGFARMAAAPETFHSSYLINGDLEMAGGLAFVGTQRINVYHSHYGSILRAGQAWPSEGRFQINVPHLKGALMAELTDENGRVLGKGRLTLNRLKHLNLKKSVIHGVQLKIRPYYPGIRVSTRDSRNRKGKAKTTLDDLARQVAVNTETQNAAYVDTSLSRQSEVLVTAQQAKHWPTMKLVSSSLEESVQLYSATYIEALYGLAGENNIANSGVILGKVLVDGHPVSGARVELAESEKLPVYYDDLNGVDWPSSERIETAENGMFAFVGVESGVHGVRVFYKGTYLPAQVVPVMVGKVSQVQAGYNGNRNLSIEVRDMETGEAITQSDLKFWGDEDEINLANNEAELEIRRLPHSLRLEVDAGEGYELSRLVVDKTQEHLVAYNVRTEWLEQLLEAADIRFEKQTGVIIGRFDASEEDEYMVYLSQAEQNDQSQIVYFDAQGNVSEVGVPGGWFVAFDLEPGWQSLIVLRSSDNLSLTKVLDVSPEVINTLSVKH